MAKTIYGLLGYPVKHSLSALMHNAAFEALAINAQYYLFEIKPVELKKFLFDEQVVFNDVSNHQVRASDVAGFNITIPHKVAAKEMLEEKFCALQAKGQDFVKLCGAVNTVKRQGQTLHYRNTDAAGFSRSLKEDLGFDPCGKTVVVAGCGGAGRAVIAALCAPECPALRIYVLENDELTARAAAEHFKSLERVVFIGPGNLESALGDSSLLVNATPLGMRENDPLVVNEDLLHKNLSVYDVVYNRLTPLVKAAQAKGLNAATGLGMLLYQGVIAWEFWTGQNPPVDIMRQALIKGLEGK